MAQIIDGKHIAEQIREEIKSDIRNYIDQGNRAPQLTAILVGDDVASDTYVRMKMNAAKAVGISSETIRLPSVPEHMNERKICNAVAQEKDVDGFNIFNVGRMCVDMDSMIPATPLGVVELLRRTGIETFGKNVVVAGRSKNVGMPIAMLLHSDGRNETKGLDATVTICHRFTPPKELFKYCSMADIIITATGVPGLIRKEMVKPGACVIDVGITRITDSNTGKTKLVGDVDFDEVRQVAGWITPVPGGVGPMTVAMLMHNTFKAAKNLSISQ